jgi:hypothetical protein
MWELENRNPPRPSAEKIARIRCSSRGDPDFLLDDERDSPEPSDVDLAFFRPPWPSTTRGSRFSARYWITTIPWASQSATGGL